ncbi:Small secreted domain [Actinacidiphila yanglinensis]|uniref:Small secreted domain n=1 Tax=Actinacidiphila yanglinensis TaxID=310779 RepID=A0A1H6CQU9_9ACTN|nr:chaplin [Actinacidiphila yanglinensis]SEG74806.1 Small secreted domain [Actinacidiphila yanglinensis]
MNKVARKGLVTAMVAGGVLASAGYAQADAAAGGESADSPGVLSGNSVQVPVHVPINVCGNTVDVVGLLNPASGDTCANTSSGRSGQSATSGSPASSGPSTGARPARRPGRTAGGSTAASSVARTSGGAHTADRDTGSAGVLSGNSLQLPIDLPINISGNSVNVVGIGNPASGTTSVNGAPPADRTPPPPPAHQPIPAPPNEVSAAEPSAAPTLAHTGADGLGWAGGASAALMLGGAVLYRRARPAA